MIAITRLLRILHVFFSFPNYILKAGRKALIELQMSIAMLHFKFPKLFCDKKEKKKKTFHLDTHDHLMNFLMIYTSQIKIM